MDKNLLYKDNSVYLYEVKIPFFIYMDNKFEDIDTILRGIFEESLRQVFDRRIHELGTTQTAVQNLLKIERRSLNGILDGTQKRPSFATFHKLAVFLNMPTEKLIQQHLSFLEKKYIDNRSSADKKKFIRENFDLTVLKKAGFITDVSDFSAIEERITSYFGYDSIFEYKKR